jgi:hypothetical protein
MYQCIKNGLDKLAAIVTQSRVCSLNMVDKTVILKEMDCQSFLLNKHLNFFPLTSEEYEATLIFFLLQNYSFPFLLIFSNVSQA